MKPLPSDQRESVNRQLLAKEIRKFMQRRPDITIGRIAQITCRTKVWVKQLLEEYPE